ncbi:CBP80/20-dependent translation initiation factor-like [Mizuhopecten yessoensis]|uniref:CBP80/20-dependent translation initiation factor n=1 Tax=Mizuhopecten yessoensis TaxID=6573 RepID=A0A210PQA2_MIZYE|nr:CBP80/20-dependent translation initiation factor-like [Mizuhopecten yessoensis]OWF38663.1 CBP80/20-dependent translation initiation factor [Mizuhopecten yessoensis]
MASTGRGRGRGRGLLQQAPVVPGQQKESANENSLDDLDIMINNLTLNIEEEDLMEIHQKTEKTVKSSDDLRHIAEMIYQKCLKDMEFAKCGACICDRMQDVEVQGSKFRTNLLALVQKDFKDKEETRKNNLKRYLGFFTFLCQIFSNMRLKQGQCLEPLVVPIFDCLEMTVDDKECQDDELEAFSLQLQVIGKELDSGNQSRMNTLMEKIRLRVIHDGLSARGRCTLLELVECYARNWKTMPNDITRFYCDAMADVLAGMVI